MSELGTMGDDDSKEAVVPKRNDALAGGDQLPPPPPMLPPTGAGSKTTSAPRPQEAPRENPFDQYYAQLIHQQNMLQDTVRVSAYQRAICENAADFQVS